MKKYYLGWLVFAIIFISFWIRISLLKNHFSHIDDLIAAKASLLFDTKDNYFNFVNSDTRTNKYINSPFFKFTYNHYNLFKPFLYCFYISTTTTYAPFQFILTSFFTKSTSGYENILTQIRLTSIIFSFLSFIILLFLFKSISRKKFIYYSSSGLLILGFSWEHIIYSVQSSSYVIGIFSSFIFFYIIINLFNVNNLRKNQLLIFNAVLISLLITTQYQLIFYLPSAFLTIFYYNDKLKYYSKKTLVVFYGTISLFSVILYFLFLKRHTGNGLNWNMGPNKEFIFNLHVPTISNQIIYTIKFFIRNAYISFKSVVSFTNEQNILNDVYTLFLLLFSYVGFTSFYHSRNSKKKIFSTFTILTILTWLILIIFDKLTLSPTRHSLILISFICIYAPFGFEYLSIKYFSIFRKQVLVLIFALSIVVLFFSSFKTIYNQRIDKFNETRLVSIIEKEAVTNIYSYNFTWNLLFMQNVTKLYNYKFINESDILFNRKLSVGKKNKIMFISHREKLLDLNKLKPLLKNIPIKYNNLRLLYKSESISDTEICFSNLTKNGSNSLYIYIVEVY